MTDSEIIDSVDPQKEVEQQDDESEEEEDFSTERITWADVRKVRCMLVKFSERQRAYSTQEVMQLHLIQEYLMRKRQETMQHSDIRNWFKKASGVRQHDEPDESEKVIVDASDCPSTWKDEFMFYKTGAVLFCIIYWKLPLYCAVIMLLFNLFFTGKV